MEELLTWAKRSSQNIWILINGRTSPIYILCNSEMISEYFLWEKLSQNVYSILNPHFGKLYILKLGVKWRSVYSWQDSFLICKDWNEQFWFLLPLSLAESRWFSPALQCIFQLVLMKTNSSQSCMVHPLSETDGSLAIVC